MPRDSYGGSWRGQLQLCRWSLVGLCHFCATARHTSCLKKWGAVDFGPRVWRTFQGGTTSFWWSGYWKACGEHCWLRNLTADRPCNEEHVQVRQHFLLSTWTPIGRSQIFVRDDLGGVVQKSTKFHLSHPVTRYHKASRSPASYGSAGRCCFKYLRDRRDPPPAAAAILTMFCSQDHVDVFGGSFPPQLSSATQSFVAGQ